MGNIFRLNSLFEFDLEAFPKDFRSNQIIRDKSRSMEYLFWILCEANDFLYLEKPDSEFIDYLTDKFLKKPLIFQDFHPFKDSNLIEWGKFHCIDSRGFLKPDKILVSNSIHLNSKSLQNTFLYRENNFFSFSIKSITIFEEILSQFPYLFKPDISFSGIGHKFIYSQDELNKILYNKNSIPGVIQSHKNRSGDFSILFEKKNGKLFPLSFTEMTISKTNIYKGTVIKKSFLIKDNLDFEQMKDSPLLKVLHKNEILEKAVSGIWEFLNFNGINYNGPIAVDGFTYFEDEEIKIALSEMNFRYSMGRILFELANRNLEFEKHSLILESLKDYKSHTVKQIENLVQKKYKSQNTILLTPPYLGGKKLSSMVVYIQE